MEYRLKNSQNVYEHEIQFDKPNENYTKNHSNKDLNTIHRKSPSLQNTANNINFLHKSNSQSKILQNKNISDKDKSDKFNIHNLSNYDNNNEIINDENNNKIQKNSKNNSVNSSNQEIYTSSFSNVKNKFIKEYQTDVNLYGITMQNNQSTIRLAVSSLETIANQNQNSPNNKIEIVEYFEESDKLKKVCQIQTLFPQTKITFCPSKLNPNLLASTSDILRIHKFNDFASSSNSKLTPACDLTKKSKKNSGPLTGMDWNKTNPNLIGVCSVDTTCTIWDLEKQDVKTHLIAHDSEVFDINFGSNENTFISTGADGSIRLFDLRSLDTCSVLFESQDQTPITRVAWNLNDNNYIAASTQDKNFIFIIDIRVLNTPIAYLTYHTNLINAMAWAPSSFSHICSVGDDKNALIWDIQMIENRTEDPILCYRSEHEINNCIWSEPHEDWIAINSGNVLKMLKVI